MVPTTQVRSASEKFLRFIIFLILGFFGQNSRASVLEDSRIATREGDVLVQSLQTGHKILSYDLKHDCLVEEPIKILTTPSCTQMYALELEFVNHDATHARGILCACPEQLFYNLIDQCWIKAQDLEPNIHLLEAEGRICRIVTREKNALVSTPVFKLELERFHVFWMGVEDALYPDHVYHVLVHNDPLTAVAGLGAAGAALAAGLGTVLAVRHAMGSGPSIPEDSPYSNSCHSTVMELEGLVMDGLMNMQNKIKNLIMKGEFLEAKKLLGVIDYEKLRNMLLDIGYDEESLCSYTFVCFLLLEKEIVPYHYLASEILNNTFPHLIGGYASSLYHIRRALELCPDDIELKENLLFFHEIPQKLICDEEARKISKEILQVKPDSKVAIRE